MPTKINSSDVKPIRLAMVLTQGDFAKKFGWSRKTVNTWECDPEAAISIRNQQVLIRLKKRYLK